MLSPPRPLHGVPCVPRHVYQVSRPKDPYPDLWHMSVAQLNQKLGFKGVTRGTRV